LNNPLALLVIFWIFMKTCLPLKRLPFILLIAAIAFAASVCSAEELQPLPAPVTNNAVTSVHVQGQDLIYSLMGLGADKAWNSITNGVNAFNLKYNKWTAVRAVPGSGRLGASAVSARDQVFVLGGFLPDKTGLQAIVADVSVYDPIGLHWYRAPDLLTPVRDAAVGVYHDRYIYVVGGFSKKGPTNEVQMYDVETKQWQQATASPGTPVFGLAGTVVEDSIIYVDGAMRNPAGPKPGYVASVECWIGKIDHKHPGKIAWSKLPPHPGDARYRIAAGGSDKDKRAYFAGGSAAIYDYNGIGMDGVPAEPSPAVFDFNVRSNAWETIPVKDAAPGMDHRGLVVTSDGLIVVGGMGKDQKVSAAVSLLPKK
jgi:N-acetylneuraminic acid mutarotase